jgi:hypothetical protein
VEDFCDCGDKPSGSGAADFFTPVNTAAPSEQIVTQLNRKRLTFKGRMVTIYTSCFAFTPQFIFMDFV